MASGCRICLAILQNDTSNYHFQTSYGEDNITVKDKLFDCIPDLVLESIENNFMCDGCFAELESCYMFKQKCMETQDRIYGYLQQMPLGTELNVYEIAMYYNRLKTVENSSLVNDVKTNCEISNKVNASTTTDDLYSASLLDEVSSLDELAEPIEADECEDEESVQSNRTVITPYECTSCGFSCLSISGYRVHNILHKNVMPPFKCDECTSFLPDKNKLLAHVAEHANDTPFVCKHCDYITSSKTHYTIHKNQHKRKIKHRTYKCDECKDKFTSSTKLKMHHLEAHSKKKHIYYCHLCKDVCTSKAKLQVHIQKRHLDNKDGVTNIMCKLCKFMCDSIEELNVHIKWHKNFPTTCTMCWQNCKTHYELNHHVREQHKTCRVCSASFSSYLVLKQHIRNAGHYDSNYP